MDNTWEEIFKTLPISTVGEMILELQKHPKDMELRIGVFYDDPDDKEADMIPVYDRHVYIERLSPKKSKLQNDFGREILSIQPW